MKLFLQGEGVRKHAVDKRSKGDKGEAGVKVGGVRCLFVWLA